MVWNATVDKSLITIVTISFLLFFPINIYSKTFISFVYLHIYVNSQKQHEFYSDISIKQFMRIHIEGHAYMYTFLLPFFSFSKICSSASVRWQNHTWPMSIRSPRGQELLIFGDQVALSSVLGSRPPFIGRVRVQSPFSSLFSLLTLRVIFF